MPYHMAATHRPHLPAMDGLDPEQGEAKAELAQQLERFLGRWFRSAQVRNLRRLAGGAHRQTWAFDALLEDSDGQRLLPLVYRSAPPSGLGMGMPIDREYRLLRAAYLSGVPVPRVYPLTQDPSEPVDMLVMERVEGESIARRILRDPQFEEARRLLPRQMGQALARIHRIDLASHGLGDLPSPPPGTSPAQAALQALRSLYQSIALVPSPTFELAFRWLEQHLPSSTAIALVHGDFRLGNFIVGPEGLRAVLDWEGAHLGDPMEDLGWCCVRSWRFGQDHLPVAGLARRDELREAYLEAGGPALEWRSWRWWEAYGNLRWGVICIMQARRCLDGHERSVELAVIGRRVAETEWELLHLMEGD
ncbi:MAG TPA: phosphotransferase family protein [Dehalococcoidia bacterium]|nr:phosphotransferase family protein [Dehalococcoidia bacterium]